MRTKPIADLGFFLLLLSGSFKALAQPDISRVSVSISQLRKHVFLLASDSLQGRETGSRGQLEAGRYCAQSFRASHLLVPFRIDSTHGSFYQPFTILTADVARFGGFRTTPIGSSFNVYKKQSLITTPIADEDLKNIRTGQNVGGLIIGTDLKQEIVVLSAHYDHLGKQDGRVYHGADDNASGTATVLSIAATFDSLAQQGIRPRRSILFVLFSGEEGGLLGSQYFVDHSPLPLQQFVCDLNVDMVGRVDDFHRKKPDYCYLITNSQGKFLQKVAQTANEASVNLALNKGGYDTEKDPSQYFYRSDHFNFAKRGIPALFFTSGEHADYHQPSDTAKRIVYDALQKRATLIFQTAWLLATLEYKSVLPGN